MNLTVGHLCLTLWDHGLHHPWNSPGQNIGVGNLSLLQGSSQPRDQTQASDCRRIPYQLIHKESEVEEYKHVSSLGDLINSQDNFI